uniref:Cupin type-1 domain-containing protein n=1 Tax=Leersia perrieri TaxID=77586 RepID=A0A0D9W021_9ORYZ
MASMATSPLLATALLLFFSLCIILSHADADAGGGRPYHFGEESFRHWTRTRHGRFSVLERFSGEAIDGAVGDYRLAVLEAAPRAFLQPSHYDADEVFFVKEGEGVIVLLRGNGRRESFCVKEGDAMVIPAGAIVYSANTHDSKWFRVVMLLNPVATPGHFEEYFPVGVGRPESYFDAFSEDVLQAAFNTPREEWEKVFERKQERGEITTAPEEQIRELTKSCSRSGYSGRSGSDWEIKPISLTGKRPSFSNSHGKMFDIDGDDSRHLRKLDMLGRGIFEMACPHKSGEEKSERHGRRREEWGRGEEEEEEKARRYKKVRAEIREGSVVVIPAAHPATLVAGEGENLAVLCFGVGANYDEKVFLAGRNSLLRQIDDAAKALVFGGGSPAAARDVDRLLAAQPEQVFLRGPHGRGHVSDM